MIAKTTHAAPNCAMPPPARRDYRIDLLRGFALVSIFINHMPGNRFENWTTRNWGFSDSAELFVLMAGVSAALAYFPRLARGDQRGVVYKALRRAGVLYGAHILSTLAAVAIFCAAAWVLDDTNIFRLIGVEHIVDAPLAGLLGVAVGWVQLSYFDILPMYVVLLLSAPALLWLGHRDIWLMLAVSFAVYLVAQLAPTGMTGLLANGHWYFNPFAWQLLYAVGIALGMLRLRGWAVPWHPAAGLLAACYLGYALVWKLGNMGGSVSFGLLPAWIDALHKPSLPISRLAHVLALTYLLVHSSLWIWLARLPASNALTRLGRNSLPVFVLGSLLSVTGYIVLNQTAGQVGIDVLLTGAGVGLMTALAMAIDAGVFHTLHVTTQSWAGSVADVIRAGLKTRPARH